MWRHRTAADGPRDADADAFVGRSGGVVLRAGTRPPDATDAERLTGGLVAAAALHLAVALLLVLALKLLLRPPEPALVLPIDLVRLGETTAAPAAPDAAALPQQSAREVARAEPTDAVPAAQTPPQRTAPEPAGAAAAPEPTTTPAPPSGRRPSTTSEPAPLPPAGPHRDAPSAAKPQPRQVPGDDLAARLAELAQRRQPAPPRPPDPQRQDGAGASNRTASSADAVRARDAAYGVKDFIRAQVERRWTPDGSTLKGGDWTVAIHVVLKPDGSVSRAEIVDDPRYATDDAYRDFARSARNAVLLASPLTVPPGAYAIARDIVLDFSAKRVAR